jgi:purine-cytosine permease-like protein
MQDENCIIAENRRHSLPTMGLLWVTMVSSFPAVLIGFDWYKKGFSFNQVFLALALGLAVLLAYEIPVCSLAVRTGLSFKLLCQKLFSPLLYRLLTACLIFLYLGWYSVCALLMADAVAGICKISALIPTLAFIFSFAMAFNNLFGFRGVANFARFIGAPAVILWIFYLLFQAAPEIPRHIAESTDKTSFTTVFAVVCQFILGFAIWGNEADYWRNSKGKPLGIGLTLGIALFVGQLIFPLVGFMVACNTGITESAPATDVLNKLTFGSAGWLAISFLAAQYFAVNDSNLYAFAYGVESFIKLSHRKVVLILALVAGVLSAYLSLSGAAGALESMCSLNCTLLPTASILILAECFFFQNKTGGIQSPGSTSAFPKAGNSALIAWGIGAAFGIITSGVIPGTKALNVGIPALQAWALALIVYLPLRRLELNRNLAGQLPTTLTNTARSPAFAEVKQ